MSDLLRILSVDLGNYNVKTSNKVIFESRFTDSTGEVNLGDEEVIEFDGRKYFMKTGNWDLNYNKVDKNYMPNLLYSIVKSYPKLNTIDGLGVILGLPLNQLPYKDKLKSKLEGKEFNFKYNGKDKTISFNKIGIIGEGFSSIYTLTESERNDDVLLIDIGGRTTNVIDFNNGAVQDKNTLPTGMYDVYAAIWKKELANSNVDIEDTRRLVEAKKLNEEVIKMEKEKFVEKLKNKLNVFNPQFKQVFFTGGGTINLKEELLNAYPTAKTLDDTLFSNCLGNKILADTIWGDE